MVEGLVVAVLVLAFLGIAGGAALVVRRIWSATESTDGTNAGGTPSSGAEA